MKVQFIQNNNYPNFKAIKVAEVKGSVVSNMPKFDIYKLEDRDRTFLCDLKRSVKFKDYFSKMSDDLIARWQKIFNYCMDTAISNDNITYLAFWGKHPCGVMTYQNESPIILDGVCSIPVEKDKKLPFVGKALFYQLFKDAKDADTKGIRLKAVTDGPYDVAKKYEEMGFKREFSDDMEYIDMSCNKHKIKEQLKEFPYEIDYWECDGEKVNLTDLLG